MGGVQVNKHDEIARVARELYELSGKIEGRDEKNWHEAEKIVMAAYAELEKMDLTRERSTGSQATDRTSTVINERTIGTVGLSVKKGVINSLGALDEIEVEIMNIAKDTVINSLRTSGSVPRDSATVARNVVQGALRATEEVGEGLTTSMKYVAKGIIFGINEVGGDIMAAAGHTAKSAVAGAAKVGGDVAVVARRTAEGILEATNELGYDVEEAAILTIDGAMEAAGEISNTSVRAVKDLLVGVARNESRLQSGRGRSKK
jgi:hypothetical protein